MVLHADKPWMGRNLHSLDQSPIWTEPCQLHTSLLKRRSKFVIEFVAMSMPLLDIRGLVGCIETARRIGDSAGITSQSHGSTKIDPLLIGHDVHHRILSTWIPLGAGGSV